MYGAYGVLAALHERELTGRGRVVRTSLLASVVGVHAYQGTRWTVAHEVPHAIGNHHPSIAPYGLFRTADAPVQIACGTERQWQALAGLLGIDDAAVRLQPGPGRPAVRAGRRRRGRAGRRAPPRSGWPGWPTLGVPAGKVRTLDDVYTWDQTLSQGLLVDVDHPTAGPIQLPGPAAALRRQRARRRPHHAPPAAAARRAQRVRPGLARLRHRIAVSDPWVTSRHRCRGTVHRRTLLRGGPGAYADGQPHPSTCGHLGNGRSPPGTATP